jgi:hypothetical protein
MNCIRPILAIIAAGLFIINNNLYAQNLSEVNNFTKLILEQVYQYSKTDTNPKPNIRKNDPLLGYLLELDKEPNLITTNFNVEVTDPQDRLKYYTNQYILYFLGIVDLESLDFDLAIPVNLMFYSIKFDDKNTTSRLINLLESDF